MTDKQLAAIRAELSKAGYAVIGASEARYISTCLAGFAAFAKGEEYDTARGCIKLLAQTGATF